MIAAGLHPDWRDVPATAEGGWLWPHFSARELACKCGRHCAGEYYHSPMLLDGLESLRRAFGQALSVNSGRRCALHNAEVGGAPLSRHKVAIAADISTAGLDDMGQRRLAILAAKTGFRGIGFGRTFLHLDMRPARAGFHYPGGKAGWLRRFGFDPAIQFKLTGALDG